MITDDVDARTASGVLLQVLDETHTRLRSVIATLRPGVLAYQYQALNEEIAGCQRKAAARAAALETNAAPFTPEAHGGEMPLPERLTALERRIGEHVDLLEDIAARGVDADLGGLFREASAALFAAKSKLLSDLALYERHRDYFD